MGAGLSGRPIALCKDAWLPLTKSKDLIERLIVPIIVLLPDTDDPEDADLSRSGGQR